MLNLSDAIRNGSKLRPPSESGWTDTGPNGEIRTCTLVAAVEAAGVMELIGGKWAVGRNGKDGGKSQYDNRESGWTTGVAVKMPEEWVHITMAREFPPCPCRKFSIKGNVTEIIWHLHDIHGWSREATAEWIGVLEVEAESRVPKIAETCKSESLDPVEIH